MNRRILLAAAALVAIVLFAAMAFTIQGVGAWGTEMDQEGVDSANDLDAVVRELFDREVIAFEVLGILLTAAMIGALVIARPLEAPDDSTHYAVVTDEQLKAAQDVSDPRLREVGK
jgi:NADH:ubiquinone oxidoreductase subunit 6 (subunit J)